MDEGVPPLNLARSCPSTPSPMLASPKSMSLAEPSAPSSTLSCFTSWWSTPRAWQNSSATATSTRTPAPRRADRAGLQSLARDGVSKGHGAVDKGREHEELVAVRDDAVVQRDDVRVRAELEHEQRLLAVLALDVVALRRVEVGVPHALERAAARGAADRVIRLVHFAQAALAEKLADAEE